MVQKIRSKVIFDLIFDNEIRIVVDDDVNNEVWRKTAAWIL